MSFWSGMGGSGGTLGGALRFFDVTENTTTIVTTTGIPINASITRISIGPIDGMKASVGMFISASSNMGQSPA